MWAETLTWKVALRSAVDSERQKSLSLAPVAHISERLPLKDRLTMGDVGLLVSEGHGSNESLHLHGLSGETLSHKRRLRHHSLPSFGLGLSRLEHLEHLIFSNSPNCSFVPEPKQKRHGQQVDHP